MHDRDLRRDEGGFGLLETVLATSLMLVVLMMTLTPAVRGMQNLQSSRLTSVAHNLGQAQVEAIRSLDYADVGIAGSNPGGTVQASRTETVQGVRYRVVTTVEFEGSVTSVSVVPQGGDGVEGFWDAGVNYKHVTVTVSLVSGDGMDPVTFETIVSPDGIGAHEGFANVVVNLVKYGEPPHASSTDWPRVYLLRGAEVVSHPTGGSNQQPFSLLTPTTPGTPWVARLGPSLSAVSDPVSGWRIRQVTLTSGADRTEVGATATAAINIVIYKPVTLTVENVDPAGNPVAGGTLTITKEGEAAPTTYRTSDPEHSGGGTWTVTRHAGDDLVGGRYTIRVHAPAHEPLERVVSLPAGYPSSTNHVEVFSLTPIPTETLRVVVYDQSLTNEQQINGATVTVSGAGLPDPVTLVTDEWGYAEMELPQGAYSVAVSSPGTGHAASGPIAVTVDQDGDERFVALARPAGMGVLLMSNANGAPAFSWRLTSESDSQYVHALANAWGKATVVDDYGDYRVSRRCGATAPYTYRDTSSRIRLRSGTPTGTYAPGTTTPC